MIKKIALVVIVLAGIWLALGIILIAGWVHHIFLQSLLGYGFWY